jgi:hypothetical protein
LKEARQPVVALLGRRLSGSGKRQQSGGNYWEDASLNGHESADLVVQLWFGSSRTQSRISGREEAPGQCANRQQRVSLAVGSTICHNRFDPSRPDLTFNGQFGQ